MSHSSHQGVSACGLLLSLAASGLLAAPAAYAQTASADSSTEVGEIVISGSRIARPEVDSPIPVVTYSAEALQQSGEIDVAEFLASSPALVNSTVSREGASFANGQSNLNLRGLGVNRTLVLVNGRRHVAGNSDSAAVDINSIPSELIERIDVVTGGASAVYGADAVSGVVNFILKRDFEGITARTQFGQSSRGDSEERFFSVIGGHNFASGRGNITAAVEYSDYSPLFARDRRFRAQETGLYPGFMLNVADDPDDPNIPDYINLPDQRINDGALSGGYDTGSYVNGVWTPGEFDFRADFTGNGDVFDHGVNDRGYATAGGSGTPQTTAYNSQLQTEEKRTLVNLLTRFEVSPALTLFGEAKFAKVEALMDFYLTYDAYLFIGPDNPFTPAAIRDSMDPTQGFWLIERDNLDLGMPRNQVEPETRQGVVGGSGRLADWLSYEASFSFGETRIKRDMLNDRYQDRFMAAMDVIADPVSGDPICRSDLFPDDFGWEGPGSFTPGAASGCIPYNIFGDDVAGSAAKNWVLFTSRINQKVEQRVGNVTFNGRLDPLFKAPGGSIQFATGAEYRREAISFEPDANVAAGLGFADFGSGLQRQQGAYDVQEVFAELNIPLLADRRFVDELSLGLAGRYSEYSTSGGDTTWNVNLVYGPIPGLRFRGAISRAVRAPNLIEAFAAPSIAREFVDDPCDVTNIDAGTQYREANCRQLLAQYGVDPDTFRPNDSQSGIPISATTRGNSSLDPEAADVLTAGVLFDNLLVNGLSVSIDWYDVELTGAIDTLNPIPLCVDAPTIDNEYCAAINREDSGGTTAGYVRNYLVQPTNVASFNTAGLDLTVNYGFTVGDMGRWNLRLVGGYLDELTFASVPGADLIDSAGQSFAPEYVVDADVSWSRGPLTLNYGLSWWSKTYNIDYVTLAAEPDYYPADFIKVQERVKHDIQASYEYSESLSLYASINNLTDEKPFKASNSYPINSVGRYFSLGLRLDLQ